MTKVLVVSGDARLDGTMKRMAQVYRRILEEDGCEVLFVDLQKLDFPVELIEGYNTTMTSDMTAVKEFAKEADLLAFFYPIWFANVPATLKGFIENLFWVNETYSFKEKEYMLTGKWHGKKASIFYSIGGRELYHYFLGHGGYHAVRQPLWLSGIFNIKRTYFSNLDRSKRVEESKIRTIIVQKAYRDIKRIR